MNEFRTECAKIAANVVNLLTEKNVQYGDSAFDPIRMFSPLGPDAGLRVRIDDKLSRLLRGNADMESDTDVIDDLIGYFILLRMSMDSNTITAGSRNVDVIRTMKHITIDIHEDLVAQAKTGQTAFDAQKTYDKFQCSTNYVGLLGEVVLHKYLEESHTIKDDTSITWVNFEKPNYDEADFIIDGVTIDLKTTYSDSMWMQKPKHDIYIYAQMDKDDSRMTLKGWLSKDDIESRMESGECNIVHRAERIDWLFSHSEMRDLRLLPYLNMKKQNKFGGYGSEIQSE